MLYVLHGTDEFRMSEALHAIRNALDTDGSLATNTTTVPGRNLTPEALIQHASALPFLAEARLVVVEGLITTMTSRRGVVDSWQPFLDFLPHMPETNHIVLIEPAPERDGRDDIGRSALVNALRQLPNVDVQAFMELKTWSRGGPSEVAQWLQDRSVRRGVSIEPGAIEALADLIGANLRALASELDKLATYAGSRPITTDDVRTLTPLVREDRVFDVVDAIVEGHAGNALRSLRRMIEEESHPPSFIQFMVHRQLRLLVRATELLESRASRDDVAAATRTRGFPLTKLMRQAQATNRQAAEAAVRMAERADHAIKTGRLSDELALELLVVQLSALAPRHARSRSTR